MVDQATWFDALGRCSCGCGKPATGMLKGQLNQNMGAYTAACAERRLKKARAEREKETA